MGEEGKREGGSGGEEMREGKEAKERQIIGEKMKLQRVTDGRVRSKIMD